MIRILFLFLSVSLWIVACVPASKTNNINKQKNNIFPNKSLALHPEIYMDKFEQGIDFIAAGNEPFWNLEINFNSFMRFKMPGGYEIKTPAVEGLKAMDGNIIRYQANNDKNTLKVQIQKLDCFNDMSGAKLPYTVTISTQNNTDKNEVNYKGCGQYLADYRLHDIWILESMNDKKIITTNFINGFPRIEFNLTERKVFGNSGCLNYNGVIEVKGDKIYFEKLLTTGKVCKHLNIETDYLQKISNKIISYQIKQGKLSLQVSKDAILIYKKID